MSIDQNIGCPYSLPTCGCVSSMISGLLEAVSRELLRAPSAANAAGDLCGVVCGARHPQQGRQTPGTPGLTKRSLRGGYPRPNGILWKIDRNPCPLNLHLSRAKPNSAYFAVFDPWDLPQIACPDSGKTKKVCLSQWNSRGRRGGEWGLAGLRPSG
jgi:hypothetical protein